MLIVTIRTDNPEAEIGLYDGKRQIGYKTWEAHRQLSATVHAKIDEILKQYDKSIHDIQGVVCYQGPGSFTGLRIGLTLANALAGALNVPIVARQDPEWLERGISDLLNGQNDRLALPEYGSPIHITEQRK